MTDATAPPHGMVRGKDAMPYTLHIVRVADGETASIPRYGDWWLWPEGSDAPFDMDFWWSDGNGGCDCNRALFFARARGEPEPEDDGICCGDGAYEIRCVSDDTGEILYDDVGSRL